MEALLDKLLSNQALVTALVSVLVAVCGYTVTLIEKIKAQQTARVDAEKEHYCSVKRSALRNEYLQIYNSPNFTQEQKYGLTRDIIKQYKGLDGNHYIHTLEEELEESFIKEIKDRENEANE